MKRLTIRPATRLMRNAWNSKKGKLTVIVATLLLATGAFALTGLSASGSQTAHTGHDATRSSNASSGTHEQHGAVANATSAPAASKDPASLKQVSLSSAASAHVGNGQRTDTPAANVTGSQRRTTSDGVLPDASKEKTLSSGCAVGYGTPGSQCLSSKAPNNQPQNCNYVRTQFPKGLSVSGDDHLKLDRNGDKVACGSGD